ncbi:MAG: flagellar biosynthetic protein FliQ [Planctomycetaceae bacterium]|jgi:flagellar biosynthesis protein FliQ|nr:flagellar biosynthetic protein FliQ [Planctomycetaceae bacterium]MDG2390093.1 flagellar biosynthetic protein FliQ [Planctomycetaceae bacterium]
MNFDTVIDLGSDTLLLALKLGVPLLLVALAVGLFVSVLQTVTQVQDQTVSHVPKLIATFLASLVLMPWALGELVDFATQLITNIPSTL